MLQTLRKLSVSWKSRSNKYFNDKKNLTSLYRTAEDMDIVIKKLNPKKITGLVVTAKNSDNFWECDTVTNNIFSKNAKTAPIRPNVKRKGCEKLQISFEKAMEIWKLKLSKIWKFFLQNSNYQFIFEWDAAYRNNCNTIFS